VAGVDFRHFVCRELLHGSVGRRSGRLHGTAERDRCG